MRVGQLLFLSTAVSIYLLVTNTFSIKNITTNRLGQLWPQRSVIILLLLKVFSFLLPMMLQMHF